MVEISQPTAASEGKTNQMSGGREKLFFFAALLAAGTLYILPITGSLYGDEAGHTYGVITTGHFWSNLLQPTMCHPPLFFILAKAAYVLVGQLWAMRLPSLLFALGTVALGAWSSRDILGKEYFVPAAWLAALSPFIASFAAEGRAYAMMIFFSLLTWWLFVRFIRSESFPAAIALALAAVGGGLTHYFFWFQLVFMGLAYLSMRRCVTRYSMIVVLVTILCLAPFGILIFLVQDQQFSNYLQIEWLHAYFNPLNFLARLAVAVPFGYSTFNLPHLDPARNVALSMLGPNVVLLILAIIFFLVFGWSIFRILRDRGSLSWLFVGGVAVPAFIGLALAMSGLYLIREKHLAIIWAPFFFLMLMAGSRLKHWRAGWFSFGAYAILIAVSLVHYSVFPHDYSRRMDWAGLEKTLAREVRPEDRVLVYLHTIKEASKASARDGLSQFPEERLAPLLKSVPTPGDLAKDLDGSTKGALFLIGDEAQQNQVDPAGALISALRQRRSMKAERFGRNLVLLRFRSLGIKAEHDLDSGMTEGKKALP